MALGLVPLGWAQGQRARASPHTAPGWPASLCPRFLGKQNENKADDSPVKMKSLKTSRMVQNIPRDIKKITINHDLIPEFTMVNVLSYLSHGLSLCMFFSKLYKYMKNCVF